MMVIILWCDELVPENSFTLNLVTECGTMLEKVIGMVLGVKSGNKLSIILKALKRVRYPINLKVMDEAQARNFLRVPQHHLLCLLALIA